MPAFRFIGSIFAFFGIWAFGSIWNGFVLSVLWGWFVVPTFHLPTLSAVAAIGIALIVSYMTHQGTYRVGDICDIDEAVELEWSEYFGIIIRSIILPPLVVLCFGWIVHLFM